VTSLDLALIGNSHVGALVSATGDIVWACLPRFDGDAVFCSLLREPTSDDQDFGFLSVTLAGLDRVEQEYVVNTPVLVTRLFDASGGAVEVVDFAPRFRHFGRLFCPMTLVRTVRRLSGSPLVRVRIRPATDFGRCRPAATHGSNHIRYVGDELVFRVTTDGSITAILEEIPFVLRDSFTLVLGSDETLQDSVFDVARRFYENTVEYWHDWVRDLSIPYEWQDEIIRAAITLKLNAFDDTGAVIAAMTTSIPETRNRPHVGLPLLLAARCVLYRERAESAQRHDHGALPRLHHQCGRAGGRAPAAAVRRQRTDGDGGAGDPVASGVPGDGAGAGWQRGIPAGPERRLRVGDPRGHARLLRPTAPVRRERALSPPETPAPMPPPSTGPTPGPGSCAAWCAHTFSSVMCWVACVAWQVAARPGSPTARHWRAQ
jgi:hypothetical protein